MVKPSFDCPECNGSGMDETEPCWFCDGTGYQSDEPEEEVIVRWE